MLPLPVRTGSVDERWGAAEDRRGERCEGISHVFYVPTALFCGL